MISLLDNGVECERGLGRALALHRLSHTVLQRLDLFVGGVEGTLPSGRRTTTPRLWGGIHVQADDFLGRVTGSQVGIAAFDRALRYFASSPAP